MSADSLEDGSEEVQALRAKIEHLRRALDRRDIIGQAKGILMERLALDANGAFELLAGISHRTNIPVIEVAQALAERRLVNGLHHKRGS